MLSRRDIQNEVDLLSSKPSILLFEVVHVAIEVVEVLVLEQRIIDEVPLAAGVVITVVVAFPGKVQPLRVTELITFQLQPILIIFKQI